MSGKMEITKEWIQEHLSDAQVTEMSERKLEDDRYASVKQWLVNEKGVEDPEVEEVEIELEFDNFTPHELDEGGKEIEVEYTGEGSLTYTASGEFSTTTLDVSWYAYALVYEKDGEWQDGEEYVDEVKPI